MLTGRREKLTQHRRKTSPRPARLMWEAALGSHFRKWGPVRRGNYDPFARPTDSGHRLRRAGKSAIRRLVAEIPIGGGVVVGGGWAILRIFASGGRREIHAALSSHGARPPGARIKCFLIFSISAPSGCCCFLFAHHRLCGRGDNARCCALVDFGAPAAPAGRWCRRSPDWS